MDAKFYSCQIPSRRAPELSYFEASHHDSRPSSRKECTANSLQGQDEIVVRSPYTDEEIPAYANLSRVDAITGVVGRSKRELRYLGIDGIASDFDLYLRYRRPCITFSSEASGRKTTRAFESASYLIIPPRGNNRTKAIEEFVRISSPYLDFIYCQSDFDAVPLALSLLEVGGNALFLLSGKFDVEECTRIVTCSHAFRRICLCKPISTSINSTTCYLVCFDFLGDRRPSTFFSSAFFAWLDTVTASLRDGCDEVRKAKYNQTLLFTACEMQK